jgi:hypothetical protein
MIPALLPAAINLRTLRAGVAGERAPIANNDLAVTRLAAEWREASRVTAAGRDMA